MKYLFFILLFITANVTAKPETNNSIAFYYSAPMPLAEMTFYSRVVVQPELITKHELNWLKQRNIAVYAYLSVGESFSKSESSLSVNPNWNSHISDLTAAQWQQHIQNSALSLKARGFSGLFLDTLDSYQLLDKKHNKSAQQAGLVFIIEQLSNTFNKQLILNRGFELLPQLKGRANDLVAEGLFSHFNPLDNSYKLTNKNDQAWLNAQLHKAQDLGFNVQVIDYAKPKQRLAMAQKIINAGYTPWVTDGHLQTWGTSNIAPVPRRILIPYNSNIEPLIYTTVHLNLATMIEYLGYIPDYINVAKRALPAVDPSLHAGIISWTSFDTFYTPTITNWLEANLGVVPELILGELPSSANKLMLSLGAEPLDVTPLGPYELESFTPWLKGESSIPPVVTNPYFLKLAANSKALISIKAADGTSLVQGTKTKYGALVVAPWLIDTLPMEGSKWVIDPRTLLTKAMGLEPILVPDTTTQSGRRMLTIHIDGDGFTNVAHFAKKPYSAEVILDKIIKHYKLPLTSSIIQADIEPGGLHSKMSPKLERIARDIFKLPYVEIASHTYSHPYFWTALAGRKDIDEEDTDYGLKLDIPGYNTISLEKEITDSIKYIDDKLAPANKKTVIMLWSGDATPGPKALELARDAGVLNVNGGNTDVNADNPSLTHVSPIGRPERDLLYQIYAPILNENVYTNLWHGPYYGFKRLTETFEITEKPYRLKPYTIYFHFYSGEVPAGLDALKHNIDYVLARPNTPVHLSHYAKVAKDFYFSALAKNSDGQWLFSSKDIKTLRVPDVFDMPNISQSSGVAGVTQKGDYVHVVNNIAQLSFDHSKENKAPYLASANVIIDNWQVNGPVSFTAWVPATLDLINAGACVFVSHLGERYKGLTRGDITQFKIPAGDFFGYLNCNAGV
ncbi:endo alpha-1,4 polygalactosaminidase [Pseudoalteromonas sp. SR45-4]|uniref:endo alpha-1,4 polygalactosaminidase n=1 Tax=Pseudoalteromonas sp. SR45-4 TaxID=2760929 RepID=UPI0015F9096C|nr:endo alpha-1,4 polygalactosaminidase [Pseudoalteromonas sp. SR45-4]MBB1370969.1 endo alpha-1,4 polygalactosaminidase [Pseudoalteromonas sp. SR45-4]